MKIYLVYEEEGKPKETISLVGEQEYSMEDKNKALNRIENVRIMIIFKLAIEIMYMSNKTSKGSDDIDYDTFERAVREIHSGINSISTEMLDDSLKEFKALYIDIDDDEGVKYDA